ncbi:MULTISPECIES: glucose-6-phosphate dehydrogenase [Microbacterium]|uniref:glucose-6-phosphate dehydrogenase n=1 Tax=Microbacterium TaxID=33882 RepID=UPI00146C4B30|nr:MULTISPECIES: glucose-6-phosphate dehydrogenase [Microbacterium]
MWIVASSDWRDGLPFEIPVIVAEVSPGEDTRCFVCGADSTPLPRTELWAVKHRHPKNHSGYVRFYCTEHRPAPPRLTPVVDPRRGAAARGERRAAPRRTTPAVERPAALCPNCFVEVPATGVCGICGTTVG